MLDAHRPYQIDGARFLADRKSALLAFDTRLGKTRTALLAADMVQARRVLVVAPAIGRVAWQVEAPKVSTLPLVIVGPGMTPGAAPLSAAPVLLVLAYDTFSLDKHGWLEALTHAPAWDVLILDEAQYLKSAGSNRTKAIYGRLIHNARRTWLLSATPTPNHAGEMWPHVKALWPDLAPRTRFEFEDAYCNVLTTPWGRRISGSRNQTRLRELLAPHVLRKRKADVIADLPRTTHNMVPLELPPGDLTREEWSMAVSELDKLLDGPPAPASAEIASVQRLTGEAKAKPALAWLQEQLAENIVGKIVVFAWHRSVLSTLYQGLAEWEPAYIDGSTAPADKLRAVGRFQTSRACRAFVGQLKAAGAAICLDAADDCAIVEPSWVPMDNYQAASRIEDVTRRRPSTVSWLYAPDTLDEHIINTLRTKTKQISQLWD